MYAYRQSPAGGRYERVVLVSGWERFCEGVVRLVIEIVAWVYLYRGDATRLSQIADGRWTGGVP